MTQTRYLAFVQCSLGLEPVLGRELQGLGWESEPRVGGVELRLDRPDLIQLCLSSRTAESVRVRLKKFVARDFEAFMKQLSKLPFRAFFERGTPVRTSVSCSKSKLWHSGAVSERAMEVLTQHVGCSDGGTIDTAQTVFVRIENDEVQISIDAGGPRMHRRGYRKHVERASLRETLAFALCDTVLTVSSGTKELCVWDPFCGAGTIVLELSHMHARRLAGEQRQLALENWRGFEQDDVKQAKIDATLRVESMLASLMPAQLRVIGSDRSQSAVTAAQKNATEAKLDSIEFVQGDILEVAERIPEGAAIACNPPYGKRLADCKGLKQLVRLSELRDDLQPIVALVGGAGRDQIPASWRAALRFKNGGLSVSARVKGPIHDRVASET